MEKYVDNKAIRINRKLENIKFLSRNRPMKLDIQSSTPQPLAKYLIKPSRVQRDLKNSRVSILSVSKFDGDSFTEISVFDAQNPAKDRLPLYYSKNIQQAREFIEANYKEDNQEDKFISQKIHATPIPRRRNISKHNFDNIQKDSLKRVDMKRISDTPIPDLKNRGDLNQSTCSDVREIIEKLKAKLLLKAYVLMKRKLNKRNKIVILAKALKTSTHCNFELKAFRVTAKLMRGMNNKNEIKIQNQGVQVHPLKRSDNPATVLKILNRRNKLSSHVICLHKRIITPLVDCSKEENVLKSNAKLPKIKKLSKRISKI